MRLHLRRELALLALLLGGFGLFTSGYALGQHRYGQPKTIIHAVILKWNPGVTDSQKQAVIAGIRKMAAHIPGIEDIWLKPERVQPRDFDTAFVIEFKNRAAADAYAESPVHKAWDALYVPLRADSFSIEVTN